MKKAVLIIMASIILYAADLAGAESPKSAEVNQPAQNQTKFDLSLAKDPNFTFGQNNQLSTREMFLKMVFAVFIVIILVSAVVYLSKKVGNKIVNTPGREIRVTETCYLGQRKSLHLIKMGNRKILIGCTAENITKLAEITDETGDEIKKV
ncbi:MAG: flagellar biosynthetic protein FliO [Phycisphaerae bacterium]